MSKAFTKDGDDAPPIVPPRASLPPDTPNYVTTSGLAALRGEHAALVAERINLEGAEASPERTHALATVASRLHAIEERLGSAETVPPPSGDDADVVRFGATVTVTREDGSEHVYRIVGVDEADPAHGRVAFVAPIARALLGKRAGDDVRVRTPRGTDELSIVDVRYD